MSNSPTTDPPAAEGLLPDAMDPQHLAVVVFEDGAHVIAHITGEIDVATCGRLRDAIEPYLGPDQRVVLDLAGVTFMDSSCIGVLQHARTTLTAHGGSLVLRNLSKAARRLLSASGMAQEFKTEIG